MNIEELEAIAEGLLNEVKWFRGTRPEVFREEPKKVKCDPRIMSLIKNWGAFSLKGGYKESNELRAYYQVETDSIHMPFAGWFKEVETYYMVWFHEMAHSTGAQFRLNRDLGYCSVPYEETIANLTSYIVSIDFGIAEKVRDHVVYLLQYEFFRFTGFEKVYFDAYLEACKAARYILECKQEIYRRIV